MSDTTRLDLQEIMAQAAALTPRIKAMVAEINAAIERNDTERRRTARERSKYWDEVRASGDPDAQEAYNEANRRLDRIDAERQRLDAEQSRVSASARQARFMSGPGRDLVMEANSHLTAVFTEPCRDGSGHHLDLSIKSGSGYKAVTLACVRCDAQNEIPMLDAALILLTLCQHLGLVSDLDKVNLLPVLPS